MTSSLPAKPNEKIVINTGPLIAIAVMGIEQVIAELPYDIVTTTEVRDELLAGTAKAYRFGVPDSVTVIGLETPPDHRLLTQLDQGEASVIQLALDLGNAFACLDERKARRFSGFCA